ncbi:hypothetical protein [Mycolicibacterium wolinskyi]|uniref:Uncharacterized protein n=1 Tax=Mycolicibacterium wolinskyi TaxID=59750 RepID=A0A132PCF4_9MYCO|nr:hypothetical protein [Mycolicibacterium wolinskyi]KWX19984.1 hypothetical protein AFM11_32755 [Mycolicibacterium wolinskyi]
MDLMPKADLSDADVAEALGRAVGVIDLILDVLSETDPLGLRRRTHDRDSADSLVDRPLNLLAGLLDCADVPGTKSWARKDRAGRIRWWVRRVGALDTVVVAFPGVFGVLADRLPLQDLFGFTNQAIVLCAVAREYGITDHQTQVRLLAAVLCGRELTDEAGAVPPPEPDADWSQMSLVKKLWQLVGIMNAIGDELGKRPHPRRLFRYFGMLPWIGAVADYFGEYGALVRAADAAQIWITNNTR